MARYEEEMRRRQRSVSTSSHTSSDDYWVHQLPERHIADERVYHHERQYAHSVDEHDMHAFQDDFGHEIDAAHSDEEIYNSRYARLAQDMELFAEEAERVKEEAIREADEAHQRAASAERKAHEAEERAHELEE